MLRSKLGFCSHLLTSFLKCQVSGPMVTKAPERCISLTHSALILDGSNRSKKHVTRIAQEEKFESLQSSEGFTDIGITIPTEDTPSWLVDGVRFDMLPIVHIKSSPNNTIITVTNHDGTNIIGQSSCGMEGFKNAKKSTSVAAQTTGLSVGLKVLRKGLKNVRVAVKGIGAGRMSSIKGVQMAGLNIVSLTDVTPLKHSGPRSRKAKRL